jgi:Mrp family chromosome partitioning ATPase/predicted Fe-Mo cluster-binding NifX family protein
MQDIGRKLLVLSGKGGVGKSTVAVNLAVALASAGRTVGLLDVDVHGPSIPKLMGLEGREISSNGREMLPVEVSAALKVMSIGLLLAGDAEPVIWRGPRKYGVIKQFLKDVAWGRLDYLVVDSPPGTGDEPLSVAQLVGADASALVVTTPQDLAIADVRRCVSFCRALSLPVLGVVENMSGLVCPTCGERIDLFKAGGGQTLAAEMAVPFLGGIPIDPSVVAAGDDGRPLAGADLDSPAAQAFGDIVAKVLADEPLQDDQSETQHNSKENRSMRIAIPLAAGRLSAHFGHCEEFAVLDVEEASKRILTQSTHQPPAHEPGALPRWLDELGVSVVIAGGMGQRAQQLFANNGITVIVGAPSDEPQKLVSAYLSGTLAAGDNICDH